MNKHKVFSYLDKDEKTYRHILSYCDNILSNKNIFEVDIMIQRQELACHLKSYNKEHDKEETCKWIEKNAKPLRSYLNSLKSITLFAILLFKITNKNELTWNDFCRIIDIWCEHKHIIIDYIKIED